MNWIKTVLNWIKKWKIVDTNTCVVIPRGMMIFRISDGQLQQVNEIYTKYGPMDYCFYPLGNSMGFKVKPWKTNEWSDIC